MVYAVADMQRCMKYRQNQPLMVTRIYTHSGLSEAASRHGDCDQILPYPDGLRSEPLPPGSLTHLEMTDAAPFSARLNWHQIETRSQHLQICFYGRGCIDFLIIQLALLRQTSPHTGCQYCRQGRARFQGQAEKSRSILLVRHKKRHVSSYPIKSRARAVLVFFRRQSWVFRQERQRSWAIYQR